VTASADNPSDITALAQAHSAEAVAALVAALAHPHERVPAAVALLEVAFGRPVTPLAIDAAGIVVEFHGAEPPVRRTNGAHRAAQHTA
jgi:hypothetical protein